MRSGRTAVLLVLAVVLTGCSTDTAAPPGSAATTPTPTGTPQEQALAWTSSVCEALVPVTAFLTAPPRFDVNTPAATRQAYTDYLNQGLVQTDRARAALAAAGPAPVAGGDAIAEQVRGDVADLRADLVDARNQINTVNPNDPIALGRTLIGVSRVVGALLSGSDVVRTLNRTPELSVAYAQSPACAQLQRGGAPLTPTPTATPTR
jgi:hypothetical protein